MLAAATSSAVPVPVVRKLAHLRRLIRGYVTIEGAAAVVAVAAAAFWVGLLLDWLLEPSPGVRLLAEVGVGVLVARVAWRRLVRRWATPLPDRSLAMLVERRHPELQQGLLTALQTPPSAASDPFHRPLWEAVAGRAAAAMPSVAVGELFDLRPLLRVLLAALALTGSIVAFRVARPEAFATYSQRLKLSPELWPRRTWLTVERFGDRTSAPGTTVNVARDDVFPLIVRASLVDGHEAPEEVEVRWRNLANGTRGATVLTRIGVAQPGRDAAQEFRGELKVTADLRLDVLGGDDRVRDLRLRAVERPAVSGVRLLCRFPEYLHREPTTLAVGGAAQLPRGTSVVCEFESNKPLAEAAVASSGAAAPLEAALDPTTPTIFRCELPPLHMDLTLLASLKDQDGVGAREPFRLLLEAVADEPPEVDVRLEGIGAAVTPQARIPVTGRMSDDHELADAWWEYRVGDGAPQRRPLAREVARRPTASAEEAFDLTAPIAADGPEPLSLQPGARLILSLRASDFCDLDDAPRDGGSPPFALDVVTPSQLRALLEKRELSLRQRFEAACEKMAAVADLLDRVATERTPAAGKVSRAALIRRNAARLVGAEQSAGQLVQETLGVAAGFVDIHAELVNNRVVTEELTQRLQGAIAVPLQSLGEERLQDLQRRLAELARGFADSPDGAGDGLSACRADARAALAAMREVLDRMLELESYNELVDLLRTMVDQQRQLQQQTKQRQREKLRSLLDE